MNSSQCWSRGFKAGVALCSLWGKPGFDAKLARVMGGVMIRDCVFRGALVESVELGLGVGDPSESSRDALLRRVRLALWKAGF